MLNVGLISAYCRVAMLVKKLSTYLDFGQILKFEDPVGLPTPFANQGQILCARDNTRYTLRGQNSP